MSDNTDLLNVIKQAAMDAVRAGNPTKVMQGEVTSLAPLKVKIDQKLILDETFVIITNEIRSNLKKGPVLVLQQQGGQKFIILGTLG